MTTLDVREATHAEAAHLGELTVDAYRALDPDLLSDGYAGELRDVASRVEAATVYVAVHEGQAAGCVTYVPDERNLYAEQLQPGEAAIRMLAVDPSRQGLGIGGSLVDVCISRARRDGRHRLVLHSTPAMTTAHHVYERRGFSRAEGRDINFPGLHLMAFVLDLD